MDDSISNLPETPVAENPALRVLGILWTFCGGLVLASFFFAQYSVVSETFIGPDLIRMLNKDLAELSRYIGEFTTFMMYFSILLSMFVGFWVMVKGIAVLVRRKVQNWLPTVILSVVAFVVCMITVGLLDNGPSGGGFGVMFFQGKLMPKPAFGYYLAMYLHAGVAVTGAVLGWLARRK